MKTIYCTRYGIPERFELTEMDKPIPAEGQMLVKIIAASVNTLDMQITGGPARIWGGALRPKDPYLGRDIAGVVEALGPGVTEYQPGDEVFGTCNAAFAEYAIVKPGWVARKPANASFEQAASLPIAAITALQALRDSGHVQAGQQVLVYGAGGGVGNFAVQLARYFGAQVTAVCGTRNVEVMRRLGLERVIDYTREDVTRGSQRFDLALAVNGAQSLGAYRRILAPAGQLVVVGGSLTQVLLSLLVGPRLSKPGGQKLGFMGIAKINAPDLALLGELLGSGKLVPVIDKVFPFAETAAALRYVHAKHALGKVVIRVAPGG